MLPGGGAGTRHLPSGNRMNAIYAVFLASHAENKLDADRLLEDLSECGGLESREHGNRPRLKDAHKNIRETFHGSP
jgi:hypothetical protein